MADANVAPVVEPPTPSIVNTPEPTPAPGPEAKLYKDTPNGEPPAKTPDVTPTPEKPVVPEAIVKPPVTDTKDPTKPEPDPAKPADPKAPTDYTLVLPENSLLTPEDLASIAKEAKASGLTKEQAEKVVVSQNQVVATTTARIKAQQEEAIVKAKVEWRKEIESDPEIGGDKLAETTVMASRAYKSVVSPADRQYIESVGLDHTPQFTRIMAKIGRMMSEDRLVLGNPGGAPSPMSAAEKLYGKTTPGADGKMPAA